MTQLPGFSVFLADGALVVAGSALGVVALGGGLPAWLRVALCGVAMAGMIIYGAAGGMH